MTTNAELEIQNNNPMGIIQSALNGGADLDELEKLLTLKERWEQNEAKKAYHKAMAKFKENPPRIEKDVTVGYSTQKGKVGYSHASLANVVDKITAELSKYELSASWKVQQNNSVTVTCIITHSMGHSEETALTADADTSGSKNSIQALGSTITYLERYSILALTGLAAHGMDNGGAGAEEEKIGDKEMHAIRDLLISIDAKEGPILKFLKIENLEDMPKADYKKAISAIEAKKSESKSE